MDRVTIFDGAYLEEKVDEGLAVLEAVLNGDCNDCRYFAACEGDETFSFPADAPCMTK